MSNNTISTKDFLSLALDNKKKELAAMLLSEQKAEQFKANIMALLADKNINQCERTSIFVAAYNIAQLKLAPQQVLGQAYIVPRKNKNGVVEATLQIGYKGWEVIAERAGKAVKSKIVYDCDKFSETADNAGIHIEYSANNAEHPKTNADIWKQLLGVIVWVTENGRTTPEFVSAGIIRKRYELSKKSMFGKESPAWRDWTEEMIMAKAIKYVLTKLPLDVMSEKDEQLQKVIEIEADGISEINEDVSICDIAEPLSIDIETGEVLNIENSEEVYEDLADDFKEQIKAEQGKLEG